MKQTITIDKSSVVSDVANITGYTGRNVEGGIDRISTTEDESKIINRLVERAYNAVVALLYPYKPTTTGDSITIDVPTNFDTNVTSQLSEEAENYCVNFVCTEWFVVARQADDANAYGAYREANKANMLYLLSRRLKPTER